MKKKIIKQTKKREQMNDEANESNGTNITLGDNEEGSKVVSSPGLKRRPKFSPVLLIILVVALAVPGAYLVYNSLAFKGVPPQPTSCGLTKDYCKNGSFVQGSVVINEAANTYKWECFDPRIPPKTNPNPVKCSIAIKPAACSTIENECLSGNPESLGGDPLNYTWKCRNAVNPSNVVDCRADKIEVEAINRGATEPNGQGSRYAWGGRCNETVPSGTTHPCTSTTPQSLVSFNTDTNGVAVDFTNYPARNACKSLDTQTKIGWRLPTTTELTAINTPDNYRKYGCTETTNNVCTRINFFLDQTYWSSDRIGEWNAATLQMGSVDQLKIDLQPWEKSYIGQMIVGTEIFVRCVRNL